MPSASVRTAARVKAGCFLNIRVAYRRSIQTSRSTYPDVAPGVMGTGACACCSGAMYVASRFPSLNSASARRVASSSEVPPASSSRQRSSRCCDSSSTISFSRVGERRSDDRRGRTFARPITCGVRHVRLLSRDARPLRTHRRSSAAGPGRAAPQGSACKGGGGVRRASRPRCP